MKGSDVLLWVNPPLTSIEVRPGVLQDIVLGLKAGGTIVWGKGDLKKVPPPIDPPEAHVEDQKAAKTPWYKGWFGSK